MSLFPAYTSESNQCDIESSGNSCHTLVLLNEKNDESNESRLLRSPPPEAEHAPPPPPAELPYYDDTRRDAGNLRVSTLYYPARPQYTCVAVEAGGGRRRKRARRYYRVVAESTEHDERAAAELRARALRADAAARPRDVAAQLRLVEHEAASGAPGAALAAAEAAAARADSRTLRARLHAERVRGLPRAAVLHALRRDAAAGGRAAREAWLRLAAGGADGGAAAAARLAEAALAAGGARQYAAVLAAHASWAAAAGHWEHLTLLVQLVAAMNFPPSEHFPPPRDARAEARLEEELRCREDKVVESGLPWNVVWSRVERLRAEVQWRAERAAADPQRVVTAADVSGLLRAAAGGARLALCAALLAAAGVPALPASDAAARALPGAAAAEPRAGAVAALLRAARRLPPALAPAPHAAAARAALAALLDPPHYFSDRTGFLSWVNALWAASCSWFSGRARLALVCWRLRWLHMLATLAEAGEARRLRAEARAALRGVSEPVAFAVFARLSGSRRAALAAARAASRAAPRPAALFAARALADVAGAGAAARWALCCAALGRALPADDVIAAPPPHHLLDAARRAVEEKCAEIEGAAEEDREEGEEDEDEALLCALLPGEGEWGAARVALQGAGEARRALAALASAGPGRGARRRLREGQACALTLAAAREARLGAAAAALLPLFPENALLAVAAGAARRWSGAWLHSHAAALAGALPAWVRAADGDAAAARRVWRVAGRAAPWGGGVLAAARLAAGAAGAARAEAALWGALAAAPHHKWLAVRGAAAGAAADALVDALLERELRLHALPDELRPLARAPAAAPPAAAPPAAAPPAAAPPAAAPPAAAPPAAAPPDDPHERPMDEPAA